MRIRINKKGFTLIEILIAMAISCFVVIALYQTFSLQQKSYGIQENVAAMQQTLRVSLLMLTDDLRMAGFDSQLSGNFGITDIQARDIDNNADSTLAGNSSITFTVDWNEDGGIDENETIQYSVYDFIDTDGNLDLARDNGGGRQLFAENVQKFGMAYAFDKDQDGELDTYKASNAGDTEHIIWAVDSDGDNDLDINLDTNLDGIIDINDSPGGAGTNGIIEGTALTDFSGTAIADVAVADIKAVRIWLIVETDEINPGYNNTDTFIAGKYVITPNLKKRIRQASTIVHCRNLAL